MLLMQKKNNLKRELQKYKKFIPKEDKVFRNHKMCLWKWQNLFECLNNLDFT